MKIAISFVLCLICSPAFASEATDLAKLVIEAYGGAQTIEQNKSVRQSGTLESIRYGKTGTIERTFSRPDKLHIEIKIPGVPTETRILNSGRGWRDGQEISPTMSKAMLLQAARLDLPYLIMSAGKNIKLITPPESDIHHNLKALEIPMEDGLRLVAGIDVQSGYIVSSHGFISTGPANQLKFTTLYSGHKEIDGLIVATEESQFVQDQPTGLTVIEKSKAVKIVSDDFFSVKGGSSI